MPTVELEAQLTSDTLLQAAAQLDAGELERLLAGMRALQAQRQAPRLSAAESDLFAAINQGLTDAEHARLMELVDKRRDDAITATELAELVALTDKSERLNAARVAALVQLARLRGVSLPDLMCQLGLEAPAVL